MEAGANDGFKQTNTLFFERHRGWHGLLVEPLPDLAAKCRRNRPRCMVENVALVPFDFPQQTITMTACDLMSVVKGALPDPQAEAQHIRDGERVQTLEAQPIVVPAATLTEVLSRNGVGQIDLLSMDVEGYELPVLQGLDFSRFAPTWMLIEARFREEIESFIGHQYEVHAQLSELDVLYRRRD